MWSFDRWKTVRRRRETLRLLSPYLTKQAIDELVKMRDRPSPTPRQATIPYIILQVRDDDLAQASGYLGKAFEAVLDSNGAIMSVMSSVVAATFGIPIRDPHSGSIDQRNQAVARLLRDLGPNVRVVSGRADGLFGTVGGPRRFDFAALIPDFGRSLESLLRLDFGHSAEG